MAGRASSVAAPCWRGRDDPAPLVPGLPERVPRARSLGALFRAMECCTRCGLAEGRTRVAIGTGSASVPVMFVGEAPGALEDLQGQPGVGAAGRYFESLLERQGISRSDVFVTNVVACRPPGNCTPRTKEVAAGKPQPLIWQDIPRTLLPLFHPAAALRAPDVRPRLEAGFEVLRELLESAPRGPRPARTPGRRRGR